MAELVKQRNTKYINDIDWQAVKTSACFADFLRNKLHLTVQLDSLDGQRENIQIRRIREWIADNVEDMFRLEYSFKRNELRLDIYFLEENDFHKINDGVVGKFENHDFASLEEGE